MERENLHDLDSSFYDGAINCNFVQKQVYTDDFFSGATFLPTLLAIYRHWLVEISFFSICWTFSESYLFKKKEVEFHLLRKKCQIL